VIEFDSADAVADHVVESGVPQRGADAPGAEGGDRLADARPAVLGKVQVEEIDNRQRDPARARLVTRKPCGVDDQHAQAGAD